MIADLTHWSILLACSKRSRFSKLPFSEKFLAARTEGDPHLGDALVSSSAYRSCQRTLLAETFGSSRPQSQAPVCMVTVQSVPFRISLPRKFRVLSASAITKTCQ